MNRIDTKFAELAATARKALVAYLTAGYPDENTSLGIMEAACRSGVDILEIGVPFSDPTCDGPVIQAASEEALRAGMTLAKSIGLATRLRQRVETPLVLFSYYNPVFRYGLKRFAADIAKAGIDGVLLVDLPPEEAGEIATELAKRETHIIRVAAPTTRPERLRMLVEGAGGFLYLISRTGVTGTGGIDPTAIARHATEVKRVCQYPVCIGFGISTAEDARRIAPLADGIIVGSAIMKSLARCSEQSQMAVAAAAKIAELREGLK